MSKTYKYAGLTKELHQRLVNERVALKLAHLRDYKQHFQKVRQCSEKQAIIILQALNSAVVEPMRDFHRIYSSSFVRKWKGCARNTLTT